MGAPTVGASIERREALDELEHDGQRFLDLDAVPKDDRLAHEPTLT